jgi:hypothetical protein
MLGWEDPVADTHSARMEHGDVKPQRNFIFQELIAAMDNYFGWRARLLA